MENKKRENEMKLRDGRVFFTTGNGFEYWLQDKRSVLPITKEYYQRLLGIFRKENKYTKSFGWVPRANA